jgi:hypothetical protein
VPPPVAQDLPNRSTQRSRTSNADGGEPTEAGEAMPSQQPGVAPFTQAIAPMCDGRASSPAPGELVKQTLPSSLGPWLKNRPSEPEKPR